MLNTSLFDVPDIVIRILTEDFSKGFNFTPTAIRILSEKSGVNMNWQTLTALELKLFCRRDRVYFLLDTVVDLETRKEINVLAASFLAEFGCFEFAVLFSKFRESINECCIRDLKDFEEFYRFMNKDNSRFVTVNGTRIASRQRGDISALFSDIAEMVLNIVDSAYGTISEDELRVRFPAFSVNLLERILNDYAKTLMKTEINGVVCYQTIEALCLPEGFAETLYKVLEQIDELGLSPSEEVLNAVLSLMIGVNIKDEYNITDSRTYQRLISVCYGKVPEREWKRGVFVKVSC
jgi:hypothetical protein